MFQDVGGVCGEEDRKEGMAGPVAHPDLGQRPWALPWFLLQQAPSSRIVAKPERQALERWGGGQRRAPVVAKHLLPNSPCQEGPIPGGAPPSSQRLLIPREPPQDPV